MPMAPEHAAHDVDDRGAGAQGLPGRASHVGEAPHHLCDLVECCTMFVGSAKKALFRAVNEAWVCRCEFCVAQAQALHGSGGKILDDRIGCACELKCESPATCRLQVETDAALVAVEHQEIAGSGAWQLPGLVAANRLDPYDVGAHVRKYRAHRRAHQHVGEFQDPYAVQRRSITCKHLRSPCITIDTGIIARGIRWRHGRLERRS
jgi:hypothetical protein